MGPGVVTDQDVMLQRLAAMGCKVTRRQHQAQGMARAAVLPPRDPVAAAAAWAWVMRQRSW